MVAIYRRAMDEGRNPVQPVLTGFKLEFAVSWSKYRDVSWKAPAVTALPRERLQQLAERLVTIPDNFKLHSRVEKIIADRIAMGKGELPLDWGMAENLAYASLLAEGYPVRLSGQDCGRGTFFHRHAVLHDQNREQWDSGIYIPLQHIAPDQADFVVIDSFLSEEAVLGFEYGYATAEPNSLVLWEAQFGDFANGAQVVIDQFIASGEAKWGRLCGLVMLLPHGYEGQGPEHSSGRIERYLQLCADYNIQVCVPSTPAQMFHLLRRQMVRPYRKPLIVFTPKSLLRSKDASSPLEIVFRRYLPDGDGGSRNDGCKKVKRIIMCSGKVYFDLSSTGAKKVSRMSPSCAWSNSIRSRTMSFPRRSRLIPMQPKWCGVRKSRAIRAHGTASSIICCATCVQEHASRLCAAPFIGLARRRLSCCTSRTTKSGDRGGIPSQSRCQNTPGAHS